VLVPKVIRHDGFPGGEREGEPAGHG